MGRLFGIGAGLSVAGYGGVYDTGVHLGNLVVAQTDTTQGAGGQVFQDYVARLG